MERKTRVSAEIDPLAFMMQAMMEEDDETMQDMSELQHLHEANPPAEEEYQDLRLFLGSYDKQ